MTVARMERSAIRERTFSVVRPTNTETRMGAKWFGAAVKRKEDPALLAGRGRFIDDVRLPGTVHAAFVRSPHPHARIRGIKTAAARAMKGVHLVLAFADLPEPLRKNSLPLFVPSPAI